MKWSKHIKLYNLRMYATHHKTGRQVRILNHNTSHWRNAKTLVWLNKETDVSVPWNRYEVGVVGTDTYSFLNNKIDIDIVVCLDKNDVQWIKEGNYENVRLVFASKEVLDPLGMNFFKENNVNNILCLDELHILYPHVGSQWDNTLNDACVLVGILLRFCVSYPLEPTSRNTYGMRVSSELKPPPKLVYITQYYEAKQSKRRREIESSLNKNIENSFIDTIVLLNEKQFSSITSPKVSQVIINKRLYYSDVIEYIKESNYAKDTIIVFANADIYLDTSARLLWSVNMDDIFFALLRYENGELFGPRSDSQDTWIVNAGSVQSRDWKYQDFNFSFGEQGCDNAITTEMLRMKFKVVNPSLSIKTHHLHESNIRNYDTDKIVEKNVYLYVEPTGLHDMEAVTNIDKKQVCGTASYESFERKLKCNKEATFCKMVEKQKRYEFTPSSDNIFVNHKVNIYKQDNVFQTNSGLVYDYNKIFVGNSTKSAELWAESKVSTLSPCISVLKAYIAPYLEEYKNVDNYLLYYLPKILYLRETFGNNGDFWAPNTPQFIEALNLFNWKQKNIPVLPSNELKLVFCKEAYIMYPNDINEVTKQDVNILRAALKDIDTDASNDIVVCMDESYIDLDFIKAIEREFGEVKLVFQTTSIERKLHTFQKSKLCIVYCNKETSWAWKYIWALHANTKLFVIQNEMELIGEVHHLACASELDHQIYVAPKGSLKPLLPKLLNELKGITKELSNLPIIYVPKSDQSSIFNHKGDSFREMIDMWEERGYIKKEYSNCKNLWMNNVGDTLLYDRPTYDWIKNAPAEEQVWKKALFGNPKPIGNNAKSWSFWARRPRLVEAMLDKQFEKTKTLVFYGKIENQVQRNNRTKYDWSSVCDPSEYAMASESEPPKFSEQEYLEKLVSSRFGLCLAGFGKKCHREVECMALGTVPVCVPEVDMDNYASPPLEGLHYIRVQNPEDLKKKLSAISDGRWKEMSEACKVWYKENCSVDGLWKLTNNLV